MRIGAELATAGEPLEKRELFAAIQASHTFLIGNMAEDLSRVRKKGKAGSKTCATEAVPLKLDRRPKTQVAWQTAETVCPTAAKVLAWADDHCSMAKHDAVKTHLDSLRNSVPDLRGVLLASTEGLPIAHSLSNGTDPNRLAAMAAAASNLGRRISESMATGVLTEVSVRGDDGILFVYSAGSKALLAVMGGNGANAGLIHLESRTVAKDIGDLV